MLHTENVDIKSMVKLIKKLSLFRKSFTIPQSEFFLLIYNVYSTIKRYDYVMFHHIVDDNIMLLKIKCQGVIVNNIINHNKTIHSSD